VHVAPRIARRPWPCTRRRVGTGCSVRVRVHVRALTTPDYWTVRKCGGSTVRSPGAHCTSSSFSRRVAVQRGSCCHHLWCACVCPVDVACCDVGCGAGWRRNKSRVIAATAASVWPRARVVRCDVVYIHSGVIAACLLPAAAAPLWPGLGSAPVARSLWAARRRQAHAQPRCVQRTR
jgi:hypothetical protein